MNFLSIQGSYRDLTVQFYLREILQFSKKLTGLKASSQLIPYLQDLFEKNQFSFNDVDFIALDKGPGAFTSLRVVVTTLNGISYATGVPLVEVNGLQALYQEALDKSVKQQMSVDAICCLLNAYSNDVYFLFKGSSFECEGCGTIDNVVKLLKKQRVTDVLFVGNGVGFHSDVIQKKVVSQGCFVRFLLQPLNTCSADYVGKIGLNHWRNKRNVTKKVIPYYLKEQMFSVSN